MTTPDNEPVPIDANGVEVSPPTIIDHDALADTALANARALWQRQADSPHTHPETGRVAETGLALLRQRSVDRPFDAVVDRDSDRLNRIAAALETIAANGDRLGRVIEFAFRTDATAADQRGKAFPLSFAMVISTLVQHLIERRGGGPNGPMIHRPR